MFKRLSFSLLTSLLTITATSVAAASETADAPSTPEPASAPSATNPFSMSLLAGHGFKDAFKTGFGGRLGYTLSNKIYLGASMLYHVGTKTDLVEANVSYGGAEVGYDLAAGPFVIRPYAGVGAVYTNVTVTLPAIGTFAGSRTSASDTSIGVWPGAMFLLPFEEGAAFVGVDAKMVIVENASAFNTYGTFGLAF